MTKERFLETLRSKRKEWEALLAKVDEARMTQAGVVGRWSVRDVVVHVTAYERGLVEWLSAASRGQRKEFPILDHPDVDYRNEVIFRQSEGQSLEQVVSEAERVFGELSEVVAALPEQELVEAGRTEWYVKPRWKERRALWECIADDSYRHYQQHVGDIQEWLEAEEGGH